MLLEVRRRTVSIITSRGMAGRLETREVVDRQRPPLGIFEDGDC
jgi:hypothetical protein